MKQVYVKIDSSKMNQSTWKLYHNNFTPSPHLVPFCQQLYSWKIWQGFNFRSLAVGNEAAKWKYYFCPNE